MRIRLQPAGPSVSCLSSIPRTAGHRFRLLGTGRSSAPLRQLVQTYGRSHIIGCSTAGEICGTALTDHSLSVAIDDFGTGYASPSYLKQMPVAEINLDRSFVGEMRTDSSVRPAPLDSRRSRPAHPPPRRLASQFGSCSASAAGCSSNVLLIAEMYWY
ncbi:MAG: EAL domain-containing protein [Chloroflexi bacterium]|nr:EAL domain-containing protein [Chloroflexota bacterium]